MKYFRTFSLLLLEEKCFLLQNNFRKVIGVIACFLYISTITQGEVLDKSYLVVCMKGMPPRNDVPEQIFS